MFYFQFNIDDWMNGTSHLTDDEELCYFRLVLEYYNTEKPLNLDIDKVARRIRFRGKEVVVRTILDEFFERTEEGWINKRCECEIEAYHNKANKARENGKKGGRPKGSKKPTGLIPLTESEPRPNQRESESQANYKLLTNNYINVFENEYWEKIRATHPKRQNKKKAKQKWEQLVKAGFKPQDIMEYYTDKFVREDDYKGDNYTKAFHTGDVNAEDLRDWLENDNSIDHYFGEDNQPTQEQVDANLERMRLKREALKKQNEEITNAG